MVKFCLMVFVGFPSKGKKWSPATSLSRFANFPSRKFRRNGHGQALKMLWNSLEESSLYLFPRNDIQLHYDRSRWDFPPFNLVFSFSIFLFFNQKNSISFFDLVRWNFRIVIKTFKNRMPEWIEVIKFAKVSLVLLWKKFRRRIRIPWLIYSPIPRLLELFIYNFQNWLKISIKNFLSL